MAVSQRAREGVDQTAMRLPYDSSCLLLWAYAYLQSGQFGVVSARGQGRDEAESEKRGERGPSSNPLRSDRAASRVQPASTLATDFAICMCWWMDSSPPSVCWLAAAARFSSSSSR